jgi:hypothetical protein
MKSRTKPAPRVVRLRPCATSRRFVALSEQQLAQWLSPPWVTSIRPW